MLYTRFDPVFFERTRLSLITIIFREEKVSFPALKRITGLSDGALYSHLQKLVGAGFVSKEKVLISDGAQTVYFLTEKGRKEFKEYLVFMESVIKSHGEVKNE
ncbi:transcriptional regulator [Spirochaetia bacterium 38H-sp]|uniref:Transcriptional regulator n=1 Tax=Rarispira pelagica TaxID=3141764 RepID=A0ABU9U944_9SPIR